MKWEDTNLRELNSRRYSFYWNCANLVKSGHGTATKYSIIIITVDGAETCVTAVMTVPALPAPGYRPCGLSFMPLMSSYIHNKTVMKVSVHNSYYAGSHRARAWAACRLYGISREKESGCWNINGQMPAVCQCAICMLKIIPVYTADQSVFEIFISSCPCSVTYTPSFLS